jgi:predicted nucleic-acid-binding protein
MTAFIDTNVLIRHLIGEPIDQAEQATRTLSSRATLLLSDIVIAEAIYVLQKVYSVDRPTISDVMKSLIAFPSIQVVDEPTVLRALEVFVNHRLHFVDAYLVASAESTGVNKVVSFDQGIDRVKTINRVVPV